MGLRDEIAMTVLPSLCSRDMLLNCVTEQDAINEIANAAALAYRLADAMLDAREKKAKVW